MKADRLKDSQIKRQSLANAAHQFMFASNVEKDGFMQAKSMFYTGVCYNLLGERDAAMEWYRKAYEKGHELKWPSKIVDQVVDFMAPLTRLIEHSPSTSDNPGGVRRSLDVSKREKVIKIYYDSGEEHRLAGRYNEAIDDYNRVLFLDRNHAWALGSRGAVKIMLKGYIGVLNDLNESPIICPSPAFAVGTRGQVHQAMGKDKEALADFDQARALESSLDWVKKARDEIRR